MSRSCFPGPFNVLPAALLGALACCAAQALADPPSSPGEMLEIAELNDVFFLDADCGWAVGDRGVIWHTQDGGRNWHLVDSPATCRLASVHFADQDHGWIVGGWIHPLTHKSSAIVLQTDNGGRKWRRVEVPALPALKWVWFRDPSHGWAAGNASSMCPVGVFRSDDGGRTWNMVPTADRPDRRAISLAALADRQRLVAVDTDSAAWFLASNQFEPASKPALGMRRIQALACDGAKGWLVGDGAMVLKSEDGGRSWDVPPCGLPEGTAQEFDWLTVAVRGSKCWIAGSPGSCILHSPDGGATWQLHPTGQHLPLRRIWFSDEHHGWAVGALGCILATHDGGRSWRVQQRGARRAALTGIFSTAQHVPWELLAHAAGDEENCALVQLVSRTRDIGPRETTVEDRAREAAVSVGACGCVTDWPFPIEDPDSSKPLEQIIAGWDRGTSRSAIDRLEQLLVRHIRVWRPDVVITDPISADGNQPLSHLLSQLVVRAAERAGDASAFPDQIAVARLEPWSVKKVFARLPRGQRGTVSIDSQRLAIHLGCSLADYAAIARGLVSSSYGFPPLIVDLRLVYSSQIQDASGRDLFSGIMPGAIGESRRATARYAGVNLDSLARVLQRQRSLQHLATRGLGSGGSSSAIIAQLDPLTEGLAPHYAGVTLQRIAEQFIQQGDYSGAAEIESALVQRYPDHMFAESSVSWLLEYYGSVEWQRAFGHVGRTSQPSSGASPTTLRVVPEPPATHVTNPASFSPQRVAYAPALVPPDELRRAAAWAERIKQAYRPLFHEPLVQFPMSSLQRRLGNRPEALQLISTLCEAQLPLAWRMCARGEYWLLNGTGRSPRPTVQCMRTSSKPYLDGKLNDEVWQQSPMAKLKSRAAESSVPTAVKLAYDDEYLYFAIRCAKDLSAAYSTSDAPRQRDANLSWQDRVDLILDVDRDYATYYRLAVDHRGWTQDACCGEQLWNPEWHVAASADEREWIVEAAVPLAELELGENEGQRIWAIGIQRTLPRGEIQAWSFPASSQVQPEGCGYLIFE